MPGADDPIWDFDPTIEGGGDGGGGAGGGGTFVPPVYQSGDWARIADIVPGRTEYRSVNFSGQLNTTSDLNGTFGILAVTAHEITLADPTDTSAGWLNLGSNTTAYSSPTLSTQGERWVGPFTIDMPDLTQVVANFIAPQGMYLITKKGKKRSHSVMLELEITPVDEDGDAIGGAETFFPVIYGDGTDKEPKGITELANVSFVGRCKVRARRITDVDYDTEDTIVDEVRWRDGFGTASVDEDDFGNITTVQTRTYATAGATSVKERKLNCRAARKIAERNEDDTFGPTLVASSNIADIVCHMALDPYIGGRTLAELDVAQIYETAEAIVTYFGFVEAAQFNYTFDETNVSFEEMVQMAAQATFCQAYRQGNLLRLFFERTTEDSILLFNHRNKMPGSETRTVRFGTIDNHDGVEFDYISPVDGATLTIYLPEDQSAVRAKKIEIVGIQNQQQAKLHAFRAFNKIRYQHTITQFSAFGEATQLVLSERVEVTDNTRPDVFDGEILDVDGLVLELSQPFAAAGGVDYTIFLQLETGEVEIIPVVSGVDAYHVVLQDPPSVDLVTDPEAYTKTLYQIVGDDAARTSAFLLTEKGAYDRKTVRLQAVNYDPRYYQDDQTFA